MKDTILFLPLTLDKNLLHKVLSRTNKKKVPTIAFYPKHKELLNNSLHDLKFKIKTSIMKTLPIEKESMHSLLDMRNIKKELLLSTYSIPSNDNINFDGYPEHVYITERFYPTIFPLHNYKVWLFDYKNQHNNPMTEDESDNWAEYCSQYVLNLRNAEEVLVTSQADLNCVREFAGVYANNVTLYP